LREAVLHRVPKGTEELNLAALEEGLALAAHAQADVRAEAQADVQTGAANS